VSALQLNVTVDAARRTGPPSDASGRPAATVTRMSRQALSAPRIVAVARELLVAGGLEAVTIREVARVLGVSAPALYKHVQGRAEIVDRLAATCLDELTATVVTARDAAPADDHVERFVAAGEALHGWADAHRAEFALLFATPAVSFTRTEDGVGQAAGVRLGRAFLEIAVSAALSGRLRAIPDEDVPPDVARQLRAWAAARELPLGDGQLWASVAGFHDLLGLVSVEAFGQVGFALTDTRDYMRVRLRELAERLVTS
jgi:AcrR family transcriptional regulator